MKTLIILTSINVCATPVEHQTALVEGDYSHLDGICINSVFPGDNNCDEDEAKELIDLVDNAKFQYGDDLICGKVFDKVAFVSFVA